MSAQTPLHRRKTKVPVRRSPSRSSSPTSFPHILQIVHPSSELHFFLRPSVLAYIPLRADQTGKLPKSLRKKKTLIQTMRCQRSSPSCVPFLILAHPSITAQCRQPSPTALPPLHRHQADGILISSRLCEKGPKMRGRQQEE